MTARARAINVLRRARLHLAMERGLARDLAIIFRKIADGAAEDAEAGRDGAALNEPYVFRDSIRIAIAGRCAAVARSFIGLTLEQIEAVAGEAKDIRESRAYQQTLEWLKGYSADQVVDITATLKESIRRALEQGHVEGIGNAGIAKLIRGKLGGEAARSRSVVIARTETHTAANVGSDNAARATRLVMDKEWAAVGDERTRPTHLAADGQTVGMDDHFTVGGVSLRFPGDPLGPPEEIIQCRCTVLYVPKR